MLQWVLGYGGKSGHDSVTSQMMVACMGIMRVAVGGRTGNMDAQTGVPAAHAYAGSDSSGRQRAGSAARRGAANRPVRGAAAVANVLLTTAMEAETIVSEGGSEFQLSACSLSPSGSSSHVLGRSVDTTRAGTSSSMMMRGWMAMHWVGMGGALQCYADIQVSCIRRVLWA